MAHLTPDGFRTAFLRDMMRFIAVFGGFWVIFTAGMALVLEIRPLLNAGNYGAVATYGVSLLYVARVFAGFYHDLQQAASDRHHSLIGKPAGFMIDVLLGVGFFAYTWYSVFAHPETYSVLVFNNLSVALLSLIFLFFRLVLHAAH